MRAPPHSCGALNDIGIATISSCCSHEKGAVADEQWNAVLNGSYRSESTMMTTHDPIEAVESHAAVSPGETGESPQSEGVAANEGSTAITLVAWLEKVVQREGDRQFDAPLGSPL